MLRAALATLALVVAGCSGGGEPAQGDAAPNIVQPGAPGEPSRTLSADELAELAPPEHTDADVEFVQGMIHHHAQALWMSALAPQRGAGRDVLLLARRIELSQEAEIDLMRAWLEERGAEAPVIHPDEPHAHGPGERRIPGMLSEAGAERLRAARGREFDRRFLRAMIRHHQGALVMVRELYEGGSGQEPAVDLIARNIESDQQVEIERMEDLLATLEAS